MINYKLCEYIKTINKCKSFTEASKELFIAQPTLSRYIKNLENRIGVKLFDRSKIPLELTKAGELMINYINQFEILDKRMNEEFLKMSNENKEKFTIGALTYLSGYILPQIIPKFIKRNPNLLVDIQEHNATSIKNALLNGDIDLCLINLPPKEKDTLYCTIAPDPLLLVTLRTNSLENKFNLLDNSVNNPLQVNLKDLENDTFILLNRWQNIRIMAEEVFKTHNFQPQSVITTSSITNALNLVNCQRGYTFISKSALGYAKNYAPLAFFSIGPIENISSIIFAYRNREKNSAVDKFCNYAYEVFNCST